MSDGRYQGLDKRAPLNMVICQRCRRVMKPTFEMVEDLRCICLGCKKREAARQPAFTGKIGSG